MKTYVLLFLSAIYLLFISACNPPENMENTSMQEEANKLAREFIIVDGHIDLPYRLRVANFQIQKEFLDVATDNEGEFDYYKAKEGGLDAPFMSVYIPASYQSEFDTTSGRVLPGQPNRAKVLADSLIDMVEEIVAKHPDKFALAYSPAEVEKNFAEGLVSLPMGMENGAPLGDSLENVQYFFDRGIRYITLTHSKANQICDSSYDTTRTWNGLSPLGEAVVKEMNRVGIMVDISHVSDSAFYDVMKITRAPAIASHSSVRAFVPGFERNMDDEMIKALADNGGVIQINFGSTFIDGEIKKASDSIRGHIVNWLTENNLTEEDSAAEAYVKTYMAKNFPYSTVAKVADHIDHVVQLVGVEHVGFGSDYDGVGDTLPTGLKNVADYPNLIAELLKRGYKPEDIEKICYKNVFRVWKAVEETAKMMKQGA